MPGRRRLAHQETLFPDFSGVRELARSGVRMPFERLRQWEHEHIPVDVFDREGAIVVRAEMPGIALEDIDLAVVEGALSISGEREDADEIREEQYYRRERARGRVHRVLELPKGCHLDAIEASLKNGVLEVSIPTDRSLSTRKIAVTGGP